MIIYFKDLQNDFLERSKDIKKTNLYIQNELKQIDQFLNHKDFVFQTGHRNDFFDYVYEPKIDVISKIYSDVTYGWSIFLEAYQEYYFNESESTFCPRKKNPTEPQEFIDSINKENKEKHIQGIEFAKYVLWLKNSVNTSNSNRQPIIPHKQKMLILYYLGINVSDNDNSKIAKILSEVLNLSEENTRRYLSWVQSGKNDVRTIKNLKAVKTLFDTNNLLEISSQIQKDIDSLK